MSWSNSGLSGNWISVASNATGDVLMACDYNKSDAGKVYVFRDELWSSVDTIGPLGNGIGSWTSVASNGAGDVLIACDGSGGDKVYVFRDEIWASVDTIGPLGNGIGSWTSVASNGAGDVLIACDDTFNNGGSGKVYVLRDEIWSSVDTIGPLGNGIGRWKSVASNGAGDVLIACDGSGGDKVYVFRDEIWASVDTIGPSNNGIGDWSSVASNDAGDVLMVSDGGSGVGKVYVLRDEIWASVDTIGPSNNGIGSWTSVASNGAGDVLIACDVTNNGKVYVLRDEIWSSVDTIGPLGNGIGAWKSVASNALGTKLIASNLIASDFDSSIWIYSSVIANICFPKGTPVLTDQGLIAIDKIDIEVNTIHQKRIVDITKTVSEETFLVCFDKDALGLDTPNQETIISPGHALLYEGEMHPAKWFLEKFAGVKSIPYNKETLYNVLLEKHDVMNINNLICETLLPDNPIAKFYTKQCKLSPKDRDIMINVLQGCLDRNDIALYNQILECC